MIIDYSKLWNLLLQKNMTRTDLMEMSGISSRVIAKLSKNQTVTTDILLRICETLQCDVSDIMECIDEEKLSLYQTYRTRGKTEDTNDLYKKVTFSKDGKSYTVYCTKMRAAKSTHIECRDNQTIYWVQFYPFGGLSRPSHTETVLLKPVRQKDETVIVLIKGTPGMIAGLDEGIFVSSRGTPKSQDSIYVMSDSEFKFFSPSV